LGLIPRLSIQHLPSARAPRITVNYSWPDAAPAVLEQEVATPLEGAFALVGGVRKISSVSGNGRGYINLELEESANSDYLRFEIASRIRQVYPGLPPGVSYPRLQLNRPDEEAAERPVLTYSLSGSDDPSALYRYAREVLSPQLALTDGLQRIEVRGGNELEWRLTYDPGQLRVLGLTEADIQRTLEEYFATEALGVIRRRDRSFFVRLGSGAEVSRRRLQQVMVDAPRGGSYRLEQLAHISLDEQPPRQYYRINGQNSIRLLLHPESGVNQIRLAGGLRQTVTALGESLPATYQLRLDNDATEYLREELEKIRRRSLLSLGILLTFVLIAYRSLRYLLVIVLSLLANLGLAFIFYYWLGIELHLYALAGITVSFGIIIDNTIVMLHHLRRQGNMTVFPALLASTLTTVSALVILFFLPERWRLNLVDFGWVLAVNLGVSLAVARFLIPALMGAAGLGWVGKKPVRYARRSPYLRLNRFYGALVDRLLRYRGWVVALVVLGFGLPVFMLPQQVKGWKWYNQTIGSDWYDDSARPVVNKMLGGALRLFVYYVYEGAGYRSAEETVLYMQGSMPPGATVHQLNEAVEQVEGYLAGFDREIKQFTTRVSSGQYGQVRIYFNEGYDFSFPYILRNRLIAYGLNLGGIDWRVYGVGRAFSNAGGSSRPTFRVKLYGYNRDELERQAELFAARLLKHPRIQEVNTEANINWWEKDRYEYQLTIDRRALAARNIRPLALAPRLQQYNQSVRPFRTLPDGRALRLINGQAHRKDLWMLRNQLLPIDSSQLDLGSVSTLVKEQVSNSIHKEDQQYVRMVEFEYTGSARFGSRYLEEVLEGLRKAAPLGYRFERSRYSYLGAEEERQLYGLLLLVIGLIFFVCAITFESLRQALAIVLLIPVSFIGIFLTFYWFDLSFDQGGYTSFILVSGLVVNSLILIINDYNGFRRRFPGLSQRNAYLRAFRHKFLPIVLTITSTALGLIPFLMHGQREVFWFALAAGTIGGLLFSLVVLTVVVPLLMVRRS